MSESTDADVFDLFISYAHKDNEKDHAGKVTALVQAIREDYAKVSATPLRVFFDLNDIRSMDDWELRILKGLRESKMMVAVLSPMYFDSAYCRKEWEHYVETELAQALPGEGIAPIYVMTHPDYDSGAVGRSLRAWVHDLKRRQYVDWKDYWPEGARALEKEDARRRLDALPGQIAERLKHKTVRDASPHWVPLPSVHFVGRRDELHALREQLVRGQIGAITALHGIPGIGKSMLAFAYAWGYGHEYPGGRFLIEAETLTDLASGVIGLAEKKGVALSDGERASPELALNKVRAAFDSGPAALIVLDNLENTDLLSAQSVARSLPRGDHIHVLVTTRAEPANLPRVACLALETLAAEDALALLRGYRPIPDDEWKAALEVVKRVAGHALAVETVAVYMREHDDVTWREFAGELARDGVQFLEREVAPEARGRLEWHDESNLARLMRPTLDGLSAEEAQALAYAAVLPPDAVPLPWLREWLRRDFPGSGSGGIGDPFAAVFRRLHRLRLLVPLRSRQEKTAEEGEAPANLARTHRLVQDIVRSRLGEHEAKGLAEKVHNHAVTRANWLKAHTGQMGVAWELGPLRDLCVRLLDQGDRRGYLILNGIATGMTHQGGWVEVEGLWRRTEDLFQRLHTANPDNADYARDLSISYERLGDLARSTGDGVSARRYYEDGLRIRQRLAEGAPESADYARDVWVSCWRMAQMAEDDGDAAGALGWWRQAYEVLAGLKRRGANISPEDEGFLRFLETKVGKS